MHNRSQAVDATDSTFPANDPPRLSFGIVVLNWNNPGDTLRCLESLRDADPAPQCAVVVDNGSDDDSIELIESWAAERGVSLGTADAPGWLTLIEAESNRGFAGGTNLGIARLLSHSSVTHLFLLNNDATVTPRFFSDLSDALEAAPGAGIIGPTILEDADHDKVWYAGGVEHPLRALVQHGHELPSHSDPRSTDFVTGCAMIISRALLNRIGPLAECYFPAYFEDGDYCHRARAAGYQVVYAPAPVVYHKIGSTVRAAKLSLLLDNRKNKLRVVYVRRNYRGMTKVAALAYLAVTKPVRAAVETLKGRPRVAWAILSGAVSGFLTRDTVR